jgi:NADP-reducing hydrogenase subunit HndB
MAKLTSVAELMKLQADSKAKAAAKKDKIIVNVSLATCSIASGGKVVLEAMKDEATKLGLGNVEYMQSGCMTYCHSEPTVVVTLPGKDLSVSASWMRPAPGTGAEVPEER